MESAGLFTTMPDDNLVCVDVEIYSVMGHLFLLLVAGLVGCIFALYRRRHEDGVLHATWFPCLLGTVLLLVLDYFLRHRPCGTLDIWLTHLPPGFRLVPVRRGATTAFLLKHNQLMHAMNGNIRADAVTRVQAFAWQFARSLVLASLLLAGVHALDPAAGMVQMCAFLAFSITLELYLSSGARALLAEVRAQLTLATPRPLVETTAWWARGGIHQWWKLAGSAVLLCATTRIYWLIVFFPLFLIIAVPGVRVDSRLQNLFRSTPVVVNGASNGHSHPEHAASRTAAEEAITRMIRGAGLRPYGVQPSARDDKRGEEGEFRHYTARDAVRPERVDALTPNHVIKLVNVDYYLDMPGVLANGLPVIAYTFAPLTPAGVNKEAAWWCADKLIHLDVNGGGSYAHELWDYSHDFVTTHRDGWTHTYRVERRQLDNFALVLLLPQRAFEDPFRYRHVNPLRRLPISSQGVNIGGQACVATNWRQPNGDLGIAGDGMRDTVVIPAHVEAGIKARATTSNLKGVDIAGYLASQELKDTRFPPTIAAFMLMGTAPLVSPGSREKTPDHSYWVPLTGVFDEEISHKGARITIADAPMKGGFVPARSVGNGAWAVKARITDVNARLQELPDTYRGHADEFIKLFYGPALGKLAPITANDVADRQRKPGQIKRASVALWVVGAVAKGTDLLLKSFLKAEAYADVKDPRIISTLPHEHILAWSCYTLPLADHMKTLPWYGFGKHPDTTARTIHVKAAAAHSSVETDFSRFDGTRNHALAMFERDVYAAGYADSGAAVALYMSVVNARGVTENGLFYDPLSSRASGSAETSVGNSIINAFVAFCTYRRMGFDPAAAYGALGLYGGDDGISWDISAIHYNRVAQDLGLRLKATARAAADPVGFLGRIYPAPQISAEHMADPARAFFKFNIKFGIIEDRQALANKAAGYLVTDARTPVLGDFCAAIVRIAQAEGVSPVPDTYLSKCVTESGKAMGNAVGREAGFATIQRVFADYELTRVELDAYVRACEAARSWGDLPRALRTLDFSVPDGVRVGDQEPRSSSAPPVYTEWLQVPSRTTRRLVVPDHAPGNLNTNMPAPAPSSAAEAARSIGAITSPSSIVSSASSASTLPRPPPLIIGKTFSARTTAPEVSSISVSASTTTPARVTAPSTTSSSASTMPLPTPKPASIAAGTRSASSTGQVASAPKKSGPSRLPPFSSTPTVTGLSSPFSMLSSPSHATFQEAVRASKEPSCASSAVPVTAPTPLSSAAAAACSPTSSGLGACPAAAHPDVLALARALSPVPEPRSASPAPDLSPAWQPAETGLPAGVAGRRE